LGTNDGLHTFKADGSPAAPVQHEGRKVTALAPEGPDLWAILDRAEV
jgi:hypothetical protein